jgi:hypothetical protein
MYNRFEVLIAGKGILGNQFSADGHVYVSPKNGGTGFWGEGLQGDPIHTAGKTDKRAFRTHIR